MSGWLSHKELKIIRGVYKAPGDTNSVEPDIVSLNLLSNNTGIALTADGWSPNIPSLKNSGVWADSPISDGRTLISGVNSNVTETMRLVITGGTHKEAAGYLAQLTNMIKDCRDFWQANAQIDPVYIQWFASCGTGRQYALIYNMDFDAEYKDSPTPQIEGTLTIERECYWRALPPGANPKQWTYEAAGNVYNYTKSSVFGSDSIFNATLDNKSELNAAGSTLLTNNCATIPASSIPGDAPALIILKAGAVGTRANIIIGKKTRKITQVTSGVTIIQNTVFNAADGTAGTDATFANDTGAVKAPGAVNAQRAAISFATATNQLRLHFTSLSLPTLNSVNRYIGRWQLFMRCRQSAGTLGDITMYLRVSSAGGVLTDADGIKLNVTSPPVTTGGTGNSTDWGLVDMGVITFPIQDTKAWVVDNLGSPATGLSASSTSIDIALFALRSTGTGVLYLCDLILIPIDEGSAEMVVLDSAGGSTGMVYDETGYYAHGTNNQAVFNGPPSSSAGGLARLSGMGIQLTPNVENKLYFVGYDNSNQSRTTDSVGFTLNIVPRMTGIRGF